MLTNFKSNVEKSLGSSVDQKELEKAIAMATSDLVVNNLLMGNDIAAEKFNSVVIQCIEILRRSIN